MIAAMLAGAAGALVAIVAMHFRVARLEARVAEHEAMLWPLGRVAHPAKLERAPSHWPAPPPVPALVLAAALALAACQPPPQRMPLHVDEPMAVESGAASYRFEVTRVGTFKDRLAYGDVRGVYLVRDRETGAEFVGVSGVGISELGSHASGETTVRDER